MTKYIPHKWKQLKEAMCKIVMCNKQKLRLSAECE